MAEPYRVCFVCSGNICRSPSAQVVLRHLIAEAGLAGRIEVDSAGTGGWHVGDDMDPRSAATLRARGYDVAVHRARRWSPYDFGDRDLIIALDRGHYQQLLALAQTEDERAKIRLLRAQLHAGGPGAGGILEWGRDLDVPDPYYGGTSGFDDVLDIIESGCRALLAQLRAEIGA